MKVLGLAAPFAHDASAALMVDGKVIAAVEEERFSRKKHDGLPPVNAIKYCLKEGGLSPEDIDVIAFPWSIEPLKQHRWKYFWRWFFSKKVSKAYKKLIRNKKEFNDRKRFVTESLESCGFDMSKVKIQWVEHQLAHGASSLYFSGMTDAAVLAIDAGGEITSTLIGYSENGNIKKIKEIIGDDSLGNFYSTMTDYLGFNRGNGEYKVMGMAPFGDAKKIKLDHVLWWKKFRKTYKCSDDYVWAIRPDRARIDKIYSKKMVKELGPEREGDGLSEPYIHVAAATQKKLEEITLKLVETYLKDILEKNGGNLCFAGGVALNVVLNRILLDVPYIKNLYVQPAAHDAGTSLGAAVYVAHQMGDTIEPMIHAYYGPSYSNQEIEEELKKWKYSYSKEGDICKSAADILICGDVVAWFQGRMEWGPRALGNRSILGNPTVKGTADKINEIIKFREKWRPFCPSMLKEHTQEILGTDHSAPFMTIAFKVTDQWKEKMPEVVHVDNTLRPQAVDKKTNPMYHQLISFFYESTGLPVVINTSLNRRGEPIVCSPHDAMVMFEGSGLEYMAMGDFLVKKK